MKLLSVLWMLALPFTSASPVKDLDLILYGASGCVGHLAAQFLANQTDLKWAAADHNRTNLDLMLKHLATLKGPSQPITSFVFPLSSEVDIRPIIGRAKAVATAAGPFSKHGGEWLVKAAAELGVHYTDTSDEFYWQREMIDKYDAAAKESGARVVLSSGFCVLAGDLGTQLALASLNRRVLPGDEAVNVDAWLETYNGGLSSGVINTGKAIKNASYPKEWNDDPYVLAPNASIDLRVDTLVTGTKYPTLVKGEGAIVSNLFGPYDARLLRRSFVDLNQRVKLRVGAKPSLYSKWAAFLAIHPKSWKSLTACPAPALLEGGSWSYRFKASDSATGSSTEVLLSGKGDPGYHFTSAGLAEAALCLAGRIPGCLRERSPVGGVFTSMSTMVPDVLQSRLTAAGLLDVTMT